MWFGSTFFYDWDEKEWQRFFEFLIYCSKYFLANGLEKIDYDKDIDNYRAYFSNDAKLEVFETVFSEMEQRTEFSVMDFIGKYKELYPRDYQPMFTERKTYVDTAIRYSRKKILRMKADKESGT